MFKVKIHEVKCKELPELNDEFAQDVSEFDTLEEYKADVKKHLEVDVYKRQDGTRSVCAGTEYYFYHYGKDPYVCDGGRCV